MDEVWTKLIIVDNTYDVDEIATLLRYGRLCFERERVGESGREIERDN